MFKSRHLGVALSIRALVVAVLSVATGVCAAAAVDAGSPMNVSATSMWGPVLRTVLSLAAVLAILGGCAWLATRLRAGGRLKSGIIEIVSGISLGGREKVVLLRVGGEEVLVGVSPAGMRALHVLNRPGKQFAEYLDADA